MLIFLAMGTAILETCLSVLSAKEVILFGQGDLFLSLTFNVNLSNLVFLYSLFMLYMKERWLTTPN